MESGYIYALGNMLKASRTFKHIWFLPTHKAQTKKPKELEFFQRSTETE